MLDEGDREAETDDDGERDELMDMLGLREVDGEREMEGEIEVLVEMEVDGDKEEDPTPIRVLGTLLPSMSEPIIFVIAPTVPPVIVMKSPTNDSAAVVYMITR